jgi:hypothetical protein
MIGALSGLLVIVVSLANQLKDGPFERDSLEKDFRFFRRLSASRAAVAKQSQPRGYGEKRKKVLDAYAMGKYESREECAKQESQRLGIAFDMLIKLRNRRVVMAHLVLEERCNNVKVL